MPVVFRIRARICYDEAIWFTREEWRGRMRALRGIGASLSGEQVDAFDREHGALLRCIAMCPSRSPQPLLLRRVVGGINIRGRRSSGSGDLDDDGLLRGHREMIDTRRFGAKDTPYARRGSRRPIDFAGCDPRFTALSNCIGSWSRGRGPRVRWARSRKSWKREYNPSLGESCASR